MKTEQKMFTRNNVGILNISPYAEMRQTKDGVFIYQRIYGKRVFVHAEEESAKPIIKCLQDGITFKDLSLLVNKYLNVNKPNDFIYACMQNGVIE